MRIMDYTVEDRRGQLTLDIPRLMELSDDEFKEAYSNEMKAFVKFFYSYGNPQELNCGLCSGPANADNLIRYFGENLHRSCFITRYWTEKSKLEDNEQMFFDRVLELIV